jgi:hypothetical protein
MSNATNGKSFAREQLTPNNAAMLLIDLDCHCCRTKARRATTKESGDRVFGEPMELYNFIVKYCCC